MLKCATLNVLSPSANFRELLLYFAQNHSSNFRRFTYVIFRAIFDIINLLKGDEGFV